MTAAYAIFLARFLVPAACGVAAAVVDVRQRKIPNWISVPLLVSGLAFRGLTGGWPGLGDAVAGFAVGFGILLGMWLLGGGGGGDVKFMAAVGAWLGWYHLLFVFVLSAILVLPLVIGVLCARFLRKKPSQHRVETPGTDNAEGPVRRPGTVPYAVPATAAILVRLAWLLVIGRHS